MATDFVTSSVGKIGVEAADQSLADIGMELRFKEGAVCILAGENPFLEDAFFQQVPSVLPATFLKCWRASSSTRRWAWPPS